MNAIAQAQDLWLLAFAQTAPQRTIGYLDKYVRHLQTYPSNTAASFADIQLAERAYRSMSAFEAVQANGAELKLRNIPDPPGCPIMGTTGQYNFLYD